MRAIVFAVSLGLFVNTASATVVPAMIDEMPQATFRLLERSITTQAASQLGGPSVKLTFDWASAKCVDTLTELNEKRIGACIVGFSAFQIVGHAAVIVKTNGYAASIVSIDFEN